MPAWALTLVFWLHMLATILWIGGLFALGFLVLPVMQQTLDSEAQSALLGAIQRRLGGVGWFCLILLALTGMFQLSENRDYARFLDVQSPWAVAILVKHILFLAMLGLTAWQTWEVLPAIQVALLRAQKGAEPRELSALRRKERALLYLNILLAILILGMTALARVS